VIADIAVIGCGEKDRNVKAEITFAATRVLPVAPSAKNKTALFAKGWST
jgi:hypothetical protein